MSTPETDISEPQAEDRLHSSLAGRWRIICRRQLRFIGAVLLAVAAVVVAVVVEVTVARTIGSGSSRGATAVPGRPGPGPDLSQSLTLIY